MIFLGCHSPLRTVPIVLGGLRDQAEQAVGSKPISSILPLHQLSCSGSCLPFPPQIPLVAHHVCGRVNKTSPFLPELLMVVVFH